MRVVYTGDSRIRLVISTSSRTVPQLCPAPRKVVGREGRRWFLLLGMGQHMESAFVQELVLVDDIVYNLDIVSRQGRYSLS
jgi:hypothetical protein